MNMYCDRYSECHSMVLDRGHDTENVARAKGWHIWRGQTMSGRNQEVILCNKCVDAGRRLIAGATMEVLGEQYPIPELEIVKPNE